MNGSVDYDELAGSYDEFRTGDGPYLPKIVEFAQDAHGGCVLEIGSGTGAASRAFLKRFPCRLIGLEPSVGMLEKAKQKGLPVIWLRGSAEHVPLANESVDFIFGCYVLQHITKLSCLMNECKRILRPNGRVAFVTASHDFINNYPLNVYFPSFAKVDSARFPKIDRVLDSFREAGFDAANQMKTIDPPKPIDRRYAAKIAAKFISTYSLIPEAEFEKGLARLNRDIAERGQLDTPVMREATIVWAVKK